MPSLYSFKFWHATPISFSIFNESSKDTAVCQLNYMNVEDNRCVYESKDAFLRLPTSQYATAVICMLDHKQSELGRGWGSYAIILLVLLLGSLTISK